MKKLLAWIAVVILSCVSLVAGIIGDSAFSGNYNGAAWYRTVSFYPYTSCAVWCDETYVYTHAACDGGFLDSDYTWDNRETLQQWNRSGSLLWERSWIGNSDINQDRTIWGNGSSLFTIGRQLIKWSTDGEKTWARNLTGMGMSITGLGANVYTISSQSSNLVMECWDGEGNLEWATTWDEVNDLGCSIWCNDAFLYTCDGYYKPLETPAFAFCVTQWNSSSGYPFWNITRPGVVHTICGDGTYIYTCGDELIKWDAWGNVIWAHTPLQEIWVLTCLENRIFTCSTEVVYGWNTDGTLLWSNAWECSRTIVDQQSIACSGTDLFLIGTIAYQSGDQRFLLSKWDVDGNAPAIPPCDLVWMWAIPIWAGGAALIAITAYLLVRRSVRKK